MDEEEEIIEEIDDIFHAEPELKMVTQKICRQKKHVLLWVM